MKDFIAQIGALDLGLLISVGLIGLLGLWTEYWKISVLLIIEFCILIGYETFAMSLHWPNPESITIFYLNKFLIQSIILVLYVYFNSKFLAGMSLIICGYLTYSMVTALYGITVANYELIMGILCVIQLTGGLAGVLNGYGLLNDYRSMFNGFWGNLTYRFSKRA